MADTLTVAQGVEAWAASVVPALNTYDSPPEELDSALPLAIAEVVNDNVSSGDSKLPGMGAYQQTSLRFWEIDLVLLVTPEPRWTASHVLYGYVDELGKSLRKDPRLGGRVQAASPYYNASYDPPEVEYQDGTIARQVTIRLVVGTTLDA